MQEPKSEEKVKGKGSWGGIRSQQERGSCHRGNRKRTFRVVGGVQGNQQRGAATPRDWQQWGAITTPSQRTKGGSGYWNPDRGLQREPQRNEASPERLSRVEPAPAPTLPLAGHNQKPGSREPGERVSRGGARGSTSQTLGLLLL